MQPRPKRLFSFGLRNKIDFKRSTLNRFSFAKQRQNSRDLVYGKKKGTMKTLVGGCVISNAISLLNKRFTTRESKKEENFSQSIVVLILQAIS